MKHRLILMAILTGALFSCSRQPSVPANEYLIQGKLSNVPDSTLIQLFKSDGTVLHCAFVDTLLNGTFTFRDTLSEPEIIHIIGRDKSFPGTSLEVWVAPGKHIRINGQDKLLKTWQIESDIPEQIEENKYRAQIAAEQAELMKLMAIENELSYLIRYDQNRTPETIQQAKAKRDSIRALTEKWGDLMDQKRIDYMKTAPITPIWIDKLLSFSEFLAYGSTPEQKENITGLYNRLSEEQKQSKTGKLIYDYLYPAPTVGIGDEMADGDLYDLQGNLRHLSEFKGKYILLDFWGDGCSPCLASIPEMKEAEELYKDQVVIISINENSEKAWKNVVKAKDLKGNQWNEMRNRRGPLALRYQVTGIPHYVLIAPDGKIQDMWMGYGKGVILGKIKSNLRRQPQSVH